MHARWVVERWTLLSDGRHGWLRTRRMTWTQARARLAELEASAPGESFQIVEDLPVDFGRGTLLYRRPNEPAQVRRERRRRA